MTTPWLVGIAPALLALFAAGCSKDEPSSHAACGTGIVYEQRFSAAGLSLVETFPSSPAQVTLSPNPALVDGNTAVSAGIDLGYGPTLAGDSRVRDLGVQLADPVTTVDELHVWVDRPLPPQVSAAFLWRAYRSDDDATWTELALDEPVRFGVVDSRFEIPVARTAARYLKVVTRPLAPGVTTDSAFAGVFVTEVQTFAVEPLPPCVSGSAAEAE